MPKKETNDLLDEFINNEVDKADKIEMNQEYLESLSELIEESKRIEEYVLELEGLLKQAKADLETLNTKKIPDLMLDELGFETIKLQDGRTVSVSPKYYANIAKAKQSEAFSWLEENGFKDLIKEEIKVKLGSESDEEVKQTLHDLNANFTVSQGVHPQTLKAFVKEQLEAGTSLPDAISVHIVRETKIK